MPNIEIFLKEKINMEQTDIVTPEHVSLRFNLAGLGSRGTALIIDWVFLSLIFAILIFTLGKITEGQFTYFEEASGYMVAAMIIIPFVLWWGYFAFFEFFAAGRTPGKLILGIRVVQENGQSITFLSAAIRNLLRVIDMLPALYLLGMVMIFVHKKHKRIGDIAAGTIVIYERKSKRKNRIVKEIEKRGIDKNKIEIDEWSKKKIGEKEWKLLKTYMERRTKLPKNEKEEMTKKVSEVLFTILNVDEAQTIEETENKLMALYLVLKDEWDY
jgi:uncharacterized RDD family membrane protein YckC